MSKSNCDLHDLHIIEILICVEEVVILAIRNILIYYASCLHVITS